MLQRSSISLDILSHDSAMGLVRSVLDRGVNVQELYLDTVGPPAKYQAKLQLAFPSIGKIVVSKKADSLYPIVSAASICAKVVRDQTIAATSFADHRLSEMSTDFGSGYPSDPVTKKWLVANRDKVFGYPRIARFSWSTTSNAMAGECYGIEWNPPTQTMFNFSSGNANKRKRAPFFEENNLTDAIDF
eukprot:gene1431-1660_t